MEFAYFINAVIMNFHNFIESISSLLLTFKLYHGDVSRCTKRSERSKITEN